MIMHHRALTLIEIVAVIAILGLLAGATAWSMARQARTGSREKVIGSIAYADSITRLAARRQGVPCILRFDLDRQVVQRFMNTDASSDRNTPRASSAAGIALYLAPPNRIKRMTVAQPTGNGDDNLIIESGTLDVRYSTEGASPSYALELEATADGAAGLIVSGLTGQFTRAKDESEIKDIFEALGAGRADAH